MTAFEGTTWRLAALPAAAVDVPDDVVATLLLDAGHVSGTTGVNRVAGGYRLGAYDGLVLGPLTVTLMAGAEPAAWVERALLEALGVVRRALVDAQGDLAMLDAKGAVVATFTAEPTTKT